MSLEAHSDPKITGNQLESSNESWDGDKDLEKILGKYDTVVEIHDGSPLLSSDEVKEHDADYHGVDDAVLQPGPDYESSSDGIDQIHKKLEGKSLIVASGFHGEDLPNYSEMDDELDSTGNWWDHPEQLNADLMIDHETLRGALRSPRSSRPERYIIENGNESRVMYHIDNQSK